MRYEEYAPITRASGFCVLRKLLINDRRGYGRAMEKPVQWMTLQELRDELERTCPAWEILDLDGVLAGSELAALSEDAHRHQLVADELLRRPSED